MRIITSFHDSRILLKDIPQIGGPDVDLGHLPEFLNIVLGKGLEAFPPSLVPVMELLGTSRSSWPFIANSVMRKSHIDSYASQLTTAMESEESRSYFPIWHTNRNFLDTLGQVKVDHQSWQSFLKQHTNVHVEDDGGLLPPTKYVTDGTTTGRLTVVEGPNFLTMPKEFRGTLVPKRKNSKIVNVDFISLEPHVAMWVMGIDQPHSDLYTGIAESCGLPSRAVGKLATLSALYGASINNLSTQVGDRKAAKQLTEKVRSFFRVDELERKLGKQAAAGIVRNAFGRPLREATNTERVRVNHFLQSTAAEISLSMFAKLCNAIPSIEPLAVVHDALVLEIPQEDLNNLRQACDQITWDGFLFPAKCEVVVPAHGHG